MGFQNIIILVLSCIYQGKEHWECHWLYKLHFCVRHYIFLSMYITCTSMNNLFIYSLTYTYYAYTYIVSAYTYYALFLNQVYVKLWVTEMNETQMLALRSSYIHTRVIIVKKKKSMVNNINMLRELQDQCGKAPNPFNQLQNDESSENEYQSKK